MIFFADNAGTIVKSFPSPVYQGSANTNTIYLIAPFASNAEASVAFLLPNGEATEREPMTYQSEIEGVTNENGSTYSGWSYAIPNDITKYYGVVTVQFFFYSSSGGILSATSSTSFVVSKGVPSVLPPEPEADVYDAILSNIASLREQLVSGFFASRAVFPWNITYTYGTNEIVYYPSIGKFGAVVRSKRDGNTGNTPYVNGEINSQWWTEVVNFNTITDDFFDEIKSLEQQTKKYAQIAQDAAEDLGSYADRSIIFVESLPETGSENYLYAVVSDVGSNLFELWVWDGGAWKSLGGANLISSGEVTRIVNLPASGWQNRTQSVQVDGITESSNVSVVPEDSDAAVYVISEIKVEVTTEGLIFTCSTTPTEDITVYVTISTTAEVPNLSQYYTESEVDALFENYITVNGETLLIKKE